MIKRTSYCKLEAVIALKPASCPGSIDTTTCAGKCAHAMAILV